MQLFGLKITRTPKVSMEEAMASVVATAVEKALSPIYENRNGWIRTIGESYPGAWQQNVELDFNSVMSFYAVYACIARISSDIAKLRVKLVEQLPSKIWQETTNPAYSPVLRKPNAFQNRIQFFENWFISKLSRGNTYLLKQRDGRNVVTRLYVLDPNRVQVLVANNGDVYYQLASDNVAGIEQEIIAPASEIIHDRMNCIFHPLIGTSPIYACGLAATQGNKIQENSTIMFGNGSRPGGLLIAPKKIEDADAARVKAYWDANFSGSNRGKIAVLGDGLTFQSLAINPEDAQLIEQLKMTGEIVCTAFGVPGFMVGIGTAPAHGNLGALLSQYYSQCLQFHIESAELCLDEGLGTGDQLGCEFDLDGLLRMDTEAQYKVLSSGIAGTLLTPNEARFKADKPPLEGGDTVYMQQQNYSLAALAKRDQKDDPFATEPKVAPAPAPSSEPDEDEVEDEPEPDEEEDEAEAESEKKALYALISSKSDTVFVKGMAAS